MYSFPPMTEERLDGGLQVTWVPDKEQHGLTIALQVPVGEFSDPPSFEGAAEIAVNLMQKGTRSTDSEAFSEKIEQTGALLFVDTGDEHIVLGCKMLSKFADDMVPLFWEMICTPRMEKVEFSRLKREMLTALQAEYSDANALVNKHFYSLLCGASHPAGRMHTLASIKRISLDTVTGFYGDYFSPAESSLIVAGDFNPGDNAKKWRGLFSSWTAPAKRAGCIGQALMPLSKSRVRLIDKPDVSQSYIMVGHPVPGELSPNHHALALANYILGGGNFSSRLMASVRSGKGKTYGISSQISGNRQCGIFTISTATLNAQTAEVLETIFSVYRVLAKHGVTDDELEKAKQFAIGNMAFQLEGIGNIAEKLLWLRLYGRTKDYIENFGGAIASITKEQVNAAIRDHLSSQYFTIAVVGKKENVASQLQGLGDVETVSYRDNP